MHDIHNWCENAYNICVASIASQVERRRIVPDGGVVNINTPVRNQALDHLWHESVLVYARFAGRVYATYFCVAVLGSHTQRRKAVGQAQCNVNLRTAQQIGNRFRVAMACG